MKKLGGVFYFTFSFEGENDECSDITMAFNLTPEAVEILGGEDCFESDWFLNFVEKMECKFGVHDWSSSPVDEVVGIGYSTYEVSKKDAPKCMEQWRKFFIKKVGEKNVGQIFNLGEKIFEDDLGVFKYVNELEKV
jgi:hypothetical protein